MSSKYINQKGNTEPQKSKKELKQLEEERKAELARIAKEKEEADVVFEEMEEIVDVSKVEQKVENNYKTIIFGALAAILVAAAVIFFLGRGKNESKKYANEIYSAQESFSDQKWNEALEGKNGELGFIAIAKDFKGKSVGNMANYYAGISYMKKDDYDSAIQYLSNFTPIADKDVNALAFMNLADAQMEKGLNQEALNNYKKAASYESPTIGDAILYRYGLAQFKAGDLTGAKASFNKLVSDYPTSLSFKKAQQYLKAM